MSDEQRYYIFYTTVESQKRKCLFWILWDPSYRNEGYSGYSCKDYKMRRNKKRLLVNCIMLLDGIVWFIILNVNTRHVSIRNINQHVLSETYQRHSSRHYRHCGKSCLWLIQVESYLSIVLTGIFFCINRV